MSAVRTGAWFLNFVTRNVFLHPLASLVVAFSANLVAEMAISSFCLTVCSFSRKRLFGVFPPKPPGVQQLSFSAEQAEYSRNLSIFLEREAKMLVKFWYLWIVFSFCITVFPGIWGAFPKPPSPQWEKTIEPRWGGSSFGSLGMGWTLTP